MDTETRFLRHMMIQAAFTDAPLAYIERYNAQQRKLEQSFKFRLRAFRKAYTTIKLEY
jgi:hypothetical protein